MALLEVLSLHVGPAVAKAILKHRLKDPGLLNTAGSAAGSGFIDFLKHKTSNILALRHGSNQFEAIGNHVAEHLYLMIEHDGGRLEEGEREAVAWQVAQTIERAEIDAARLVHYDLNPADLRTQLLQDALTASRDFSAAGAHLYREIISECCQCIVDIASQLPAFTERSFAEVLSRQRQLERIAAATLEEVHKIRAQSQQGTPEAARFEADYRRAVIRRLDELELFGADVSHASRRHRLSVAYVSLSVMQPRRAALPSERDADARDEATDLDHEAITLTADEALSQSNSLVVRGLAGSGKTTLLQWIAVCAAQESFPDTLAAWRNTVPFFIRLRQVTGEVFPAPEDFPRLAVPSLAGTMPEGWVHAQLQAGRGIVLVDGVDEVAASKRQAVQDWLRDLVGTYPACRFVVSSRPHAINEGWLTSEGFDEAELQPMDRGNIGTFIDHWHRAVREALQDEADKIALDGLAAPLKQVVAHSRQLRDLATNPLLCAMLCALNRDRREQLPSDRMELYAACCEMLIDRRDRERHIQLPDYPHLTYRQKLSLLQDFAYWLLRNGWSEVSVDKADERFAGRLPYLSGLEGQVTGADIRRVFVDRTGIMREPVTGEIDFTHRTFLEYLAAQGALDEGAVGELVRNAHDDQWREVIILAVGQAGLHVRGEILTALVTRGDAEEEHRYVLHMLAVACLETAVVLDTAVKAAVQERLQGLVPPQNLTDAKALAASGALAIPYLRRGRRKGRAKEAAACIHALARIGGEAALEALAEYADDGRNSVSEELWKSWEYFDKEAYARRVLNPHYSINSRVARTNILSADLEVLQYLTNLTSLDLRGTQVSDVSALASLTQLTFLDLRGTQVSDVSALASLTQLTFLNLMGTQVSDVSALASLTQLTLLNLMGTQVSDVSALASLTQLTFFNLMGTQESMLPEMVQLPGGTFSMGDQNGGESEKPVHAVTLSPFAMGKYPVTIEQYDLFCDATGKEKPHDRGWGRGRRPVIDVSWHDAVAYCAWLSERMGREYRLPTEAEWEYAARAGGQQTYSFGDDATALGAYAWYAENAGGQTHPVGQKCPNAWGFYDMHGNVWEWVQDWYSATYYQDSPPVDPQGPDTGAFRVIRGGGWFGGARTCVLPTATRTTLASAMTTLASAARVQCQASKRRAVPAGGGEASEAKGGAAEGRAPQAGTARSSARDNTRRMRQVQTRAWSLCTDRTNERLFEIM